ncbi:response regulator transcription factor [Mesonia sp. K4-1]|jgi:DNA-binding response OmpR family regulator|uniref:response regulator transcription factor n=1 Tax=Mesonia sp. K4-1 TaxID=2602760 RepID=UPI0011CC94B9|nr:response regulator transcription factor [Mesonia sp. K4-1]TXK76072.1 response regulator transcription factor [Mesonia sp. K4-1]
MIKAHLLLVEDDYDFGSILKQYLEVHGYQVSWAINGQRALELLQKEEEMPFSIAVLDVMMPEIDGFQLAEKMIQQSPEVPFIFLTARKLKEDKIKGLKLGADDYIVKPFDADILVLRIQNILRRTQQHTKQPETEDKIKISTYYLDTQNYCLLREGKVQKITEKEAALIGFLYQNKNKLLKREVILQQLWGDADFFSGRSMDVFISRLRKYFKEDSRIKIESTRGIGLTFQVEQ